MLRLALIATTALALAAPVLAGEQAGGRPATLGVYFGTYTGGKSKGIYRAELDLRTGKLSTPILAAAVKNPSFVAIHPSGRYLYAVSEISESGGKRTGAVSAFLIDPKTGTLKLLNSQPSGGAGPCHLIVDRAGKNALVANYGGGSAAVLPIQSDGQLNPASCVVQHKGSSVDKSRQEAPHAHSINLDAANKFAFVADLGLDKVLVYRYDADKGTLTPNDPPAAKLEPGAGPRHFAFHPDGQAAYVINELSSTITQMNYDPKRGVLTPLQTVSTLPGGKAVKGNSTAEVVVHPSGKFAYGSNRGHNSLAMYAIDAKTHRLTPTGHETRDIKVPRNFAIEPSGAYLLAASQASGRVIVFRIDRGTGVLTPTGSAIDVPNAVCVRFLAPR